MKLAMFDSDETPIFSDSQVASLRMLFAGLALSPIAIRAIRKLGSRKNVILLAVVGFSGNFFPAFLFTYAETGLSSGYTGMLNSFTPIFALIIGALVFRNKLTKIQFVGTLIGIAGIFCLMIAGNDLSIKGNWTHITAIVVATLFYGISLNTIKFTLQHLKGYEISALSFLLILLPSIIISFGSGTLETLQYNKNASQGLIAILILSLIGTALAVVLFNTLITNSSILFASSVTYLIPVFAVFFGLAFGEKINLYQVISMLLVLGGVFVANFLPGILDKKSTLK